MKAYPLKPHAVFQYIGDDDALQEFLDGEFPYDYAYEEGDWFITSPDGNFFIVSDEEFFDNWRIYEEEADTR